MPTDMNTATVVPDPPATCFACNGRRVLRWHDAVEQKDKVSTCWACAAADYHDPQDT